MDDIDRHIVRELRRDGRMSYKDLGARIGLAPSTTLGRVRALERDGVITGYRAEVAARPMGMGIEALVFVRLRPKNDASVRHFVDEVWKIDATTAVYLVTGGDDAIIHVTVPTTEVLRATVLEQIGRIESVVDERTSLVFEHRSR